MATVHPPPPQGPLTPIFFSVPVGSTICRIYDPDAYAATATGFRLSGPFARFDHHIRSDRKRGILYAAEEIKGALVEIYGDNRFGRSKNRRYCEIEIQRELRLLELRGDGSANAGTITAMSTGPYAMSQRWSRYFYVTYPKIDGLVFANAHNGDTAVALYERTHDAFGAPLLDVRLDDMLIRDRVVKVALAANLCIGFY